MKRILLILMCALMLVSVTACGDKVKEKAKDEDKKTESTKNPEGNGDAEDKPGDNIVDYVDKSKESTDATSCDYVKSAVAAGATVEEAYKEMSSSDGKKWLLISFDDGMKFSSLEDCSALEAELYSTLSDLSAPKADGKVAYLVTWISDTGELLNFNVETIDSTLAESYLKASSENVTNESEEDEPEVDDPKVEEETLTGFEEIMLYDTAMHVFDDAEILTDEAEDRLELDCDELKKQLQTDIVFITVAEYPADNYDMTYENILRARYTDGYVESNDVVFIDMGKREIRIFSGDGHEENGIYLNDDQCNEIYEAMLSDLSAGDFDKAFNIYIAMVQDFYNN